MKHNNSLLWRTTNNIAAVNEYEEEYTPKIGKNKPIHGKLFTEYTEITEPGEEVYDYWKFKKEYDEHISNEIRINKTLNYTNEDVTEKAVKEVLSELLNFKNCTETLKKIDVKAVDCLMHNYEQEKNNPAVKNTLRKMQLIIKVWFIIYVCLSIFCWCHRGWCCCCFRCKFCFPKKRILFAKQYYAVNPPGILNSDIKRKGETQQLINFEASEFERDAYEKFQSALRNL